MKTGLHTLHAVDTGHELRIWDLKTNTQQQTISVGSKTAYARPPLCFEEYKSALQIRGRNPCISIWDIRRPKEEFNQFFCGTDCIDMSRGKSMHAQKIRFLRLMPIEKCGRRK